MPYRGTSGGGCPAVAWEVWYRRGAWPGTMPLYDFRCRTCAVEFEALVRPPTDPACPSCGGADLEKLLSGFSFSVRSGGLSSAARRAVQKQQAGQKRDHDAFQREIEQKHFDD